METKPEGSAIELTWKQPFDVDIDVDVVWVDQGFL